MTAQTKQQKIRELITRLPEDQQTILVRKLERVLIRQRALRRFPSPAHLSQFWRPEFVQTPMLDAIDTAIIQAEAGYQRRWIINTPPQRGKTSRMQDGAAWLLLRNPRLNIVFASYEQGIAARSSLAIRQMIETYGSGYRKHKNDPDHVDHLGLLLDPDRAQQANWSLADVPDGSQHKPGGLYAVGVGGALTGRAADVVIVDDPVKDARQADSEHQRNIIKSWFQSVVLTRLSRNAIVFVVQTRWHEDDLSGKLLSGEIEGDWAHLNIPAQAGENDILGRQPGEYLTDTRGLNREDWERIKREVGQRTWYALYQGDPSPPEGGIFKRDWFDHNRVNELPEMLTVRTFVDPADNLGEGDEAGIITGGIGVDKKIYILADDSGHYTVSQWFRTAIYSMIKHNGTKLWFEKSLSGLKRAMSAEWRIMRQQAREIITAHRHHYGDTPLPGKPTKDVLHDAIEACTDKDDTPTYRRTIQQQLTDLWPHAHTITQLPHEGPSIQGIVAKGSKTFRAEMVSPLYENGTVSHYQHLPTLERQMSTWLPTQDSPDRMDAAVHLITQLNATKAGETTVNKPTGTINTHTVNRTNTIGRSITQRR